MSAPSPPPPAPLPVAPVVAADDSDKKREDQLRRRRLGRAGTVATSPRGVLRARDANVVRKTLLGE